MILTWGYRFPLSRERHKRAITLGFAPRIARALLQQWTARLLALTVY
jgi:hypothetical protein